MAPHAVIHSCRNLNSEGTGVSLFALLAVPGCPALPLVRQRLLWRLLCILLRLRRPCGCGIPQDPFSPRNLHSCLTDTSLGAWPRLAVQAVPLRLTTAGGCLATAGGSLVTAGGGCRKAWSGICIHKELVDMEDALDAILECCSNEYHLPRCYVSILLVYAAIS